MTTRPPPLRIKGQLLFFDVFQSFNYHFYHKTRKLSLLDGSLIELNLIKFEMFCSFITVTITFSFVPAPNWVVIHIIVSLPQVAITGSKVCQIRKSTNSL